jgi:hypothetical protein
MHQSTETEILLLCARPELDDAAVGRLLGLLQDGPDWHLLFELANGYRMTPRLTLWLNRHAQDLLIDEVRSALHEYHVQSTRHNLLLAAEVLRIIDLLAAAGMDVVSFKGPVSAMLVYGDLALRACGDIDLLVRQHDHARAEQILESTGYKVMQHYDVAMQSSLWHEQRQISVDLHWGIPPDHLHLRSDLLWEAVEPVELLGRPVPSFSARDTLLVTAVNVVKEYWKPSLHQLTDVVVITRDYRDEDWRAAFSRARDIGCQRLLVAALLLARRLLDVPLPAAGPARLFRHKGLNRAVDELAYHLFLPFDEQSPAAALKPVHLRHARNYYLAMTDSFRQRVYDWLMWAGAPNQADEGFVKLPKHLTFLYILIRPLRLLIKRL